MARFSFFIVISLFFTGCVKDKEIDWEELIINCEPSEFGLIEKYSCDSSLNYDPTFFCDYINLGDVSLLPETKKHSKYMCSLMQSVIFENNNGNELVFEKSAYAAQYATQWSDVCTDNPNKSILYCAANEEATAILINDSLGLEFRIMMIVDTRDENIPLDDRDRLFITVPRTSDFGVYHSLILSYYVKRGNVYESFNSRYNFEEEFVLNGESYQNVTYVIPSQDAGQQEIYYAEKYGIIGFRDYKGVLWTFKKFA